MTRFLIKHFLKGHDSPEAPASRFAIGKLAGTMGIVCNCLLASGKLIAGLIIGSVSVVADAANNISDVASSVVTLFGFRMAQRPADKEHPYGHARYEYISGLVVAAIILLIGSELVKTSVNKIFAKAEIDVSIATMIILIVSICVKLWMALFYKTLGNKIGSVALLAAAADSRNDVITTSAVLLGCVTNAACHLNIDGYIGLGVSVFILYSGVGIARSTVSPLLGESVKAELYDEIEKLILSHEKVLGIHDMLVHDYGPGQCYASVHLELDADENPLVCHDIIDDIECDVSEKLNVHLTIHFDPVVKNNEEQNEMQKTVAEITEKFYPQLSIHDFRLVKGVNQTKLVFDMSVPYSMFGRRAEIKKKIDTELASLGKEYITTIRFDGK